MNNRGNFDHKIVLSCCTGSLLSYKTNPFFPYFCCYGNSEISYGNSEITHCVLFTPEIFYRCEFSRLLCGSSWEILNLK